MAELIQAVISWQMLLIVLLVFGVAPGLALRLILRIYPKAHPRRRELIGELYKVPHWERPLFVAEQLELVLTEGIPARLRFTRAQHAEHPFVKLDEWMRRLRPVLYGTIWWLFAIASYLLVTEVNYWFGGILGGSVLIFGFMTVLIIAVFTTLAVRDSAERAERRRRMQARREQKTLRRPK